MPLVTTIDLSRPEYRQMEVTLDYLAWSQAELARDKFVDHSINIEFSSELLLQQIALDVHLGNLELAEKELSTLSEETLSEEKRLCFEYLRLSAELAMRKGNTEEEQGFLERAWRIASPEFVTYQAVGTRLAALCLAKGKVEPARQLCMQILSENTESVSARLLYCILLKENKETELLTEELRILAEYNHSIGPDAFWSSEKAVSSRWYTHDTAVDYPGEALMAHKIAQDYYNADQMGAAGIDQGLKLGVSLLNKGLNFLNNRGGGPSD